jgi:hypothetical protein
MDSRSPGTSLVRHPGGAHVESPDDPSRSLPLSTRSTEDLERARCHHERALNALQNGSADALNSAVRTRLIRRLQQDLYALQRALAHRQAPRKGSAARLSAHSKGSAP